MRRLLTLTGAVACSAMLSATSVAHASTYQVIYQSPADQTFTPYVGGVRKGLIYGTEPTGGANSAGVLFTLSPSGQYTPIYTFSGSDGAQPNARLVIDSKGTAYGTTEFGGDQGVGTVFAISAQGQLLLSDSLQAGTDGSYPLDGLAVGTDHAGYGTTSQGAIAPGNGTLFRVTAGGTLGVVYSFLSSPTDGHCPFTGVVIDKAGNIYGTTVGFGFGGQPLGAVWKMPPGGVPTTIYSFTNGTDGEFPQITPTLDADDNLWGVSQTNVSPSAGSVWEITATGFQVVHVFGGDADGDTPNGPLLLGSDGNMYGTTLGGGIAAGAAGYGTIFSITPQGVLTTVHAFAGGSDGALPTGSLAMDPAGRIYGGTRSGAVFMVTP